MPMKVTVCFDRVRVIVPCGDGELPVRDLINKAIVRYRKAIGKSSDHWVTVHNLKTSNDGGILDPDDLLNDVVDDREQLIADYDEQGGHSYHPHNGDGASASSAGTASPDIFSSSDTQSTTYPDSKEVHGYQGDGTHDIIVTPKDFSVGSGLTVRHGSEPMLNVLEVDLNNPADKKPPHTKEKDESKPIGIVHAKQASMDDGRSTNPFNRLARDSWRQSLGNRPDMYKWLEAQERQQEKYRQIERREPLGGVSTDQNKENLTIKPPVVKPAMGVTTEKNKDNVTSKPPPIKQPLLPAGTIPLVLVNDGGPLGIHVVPEYGDDGKEIGLLVQGVEPGGRVHKDGRLQVNDRIIEINGKNLAGISFARAQEIFRFAMKTNEIKLQVLKRKLPPLPKNPPPTLPKPKGHSPVKPSPLTLPPTKIESNGPVSPLSPEQTSTPAGSVPSSSPEVTDMKPPFSQNSDMDNKQVKEGPPIRPSSPLKKIPPAPPTRNPTTALSADSQQKAIIAPTNTKKIGKKITIELLKGPQGLGFSVTTRDNPAGGDTPIYIKNILPKGAAITDKRLKAGDRLLEVNGINMMNKTQSEAVAVLRNCDQGSMVNIVVSRQEVVEERFKVPRELLRSYADEKGQERRDQPTEKSGDEDGSLASTKNKEIINLNVPLNDSGSAGLGVSVKGKTLTTDQGQKDLGIFIKAVIHGGAASKDGRLLINDQLVEVNGYTLTGLSNTDAMETLRKAMQLDGPTPGHIHLVIARRIGAPSPSPYQEYSTDYNLFNQSDEQPSSAEFVQENAIDVSKDEIDSKTAESCDNGASSNLKVKNFFLLDKLTGGGNGLRNDSYTRATHESFNDSANMFAVGLSPFGKSKVSRDDSVIIEEDNEQQKQNLRPHSTLGIRMSSSTHSLSSSSDDVDQPPPWLQGPDWNRHESTTSEELSPLPIDPFSRDALGRRSMSEKRRGHLDPRGSEMYQKAKNIRDSQRGVSHRSSSFHVTGKLGSQYLVRAGSAESLIGRPKPNARVPPLPLHGFAQPQKTSTPASNLKRFSSLENLAVTTSSLDQEEQNASQETEEETTNEEDAQNYPQFPMSRGRGCNESFRAAVDRSYDISDRPSMDTRSTYINGYDVDDDDDDIDDDGDDDYNPSLQSSLGFSYRPYGGILSIDLKQIQHEGEVEEESSESGSLGVSGPTNSARSSVSSETPSEEANKKGGRRKVKEKKGGILKGIFRLGRNKKSQEMSAKSEAERLEEEAEKDMMNREEVAKRALQDQERLKEQYRRLHGDVIYPGDPHRQPPYQVLDAHAQQSYHILEDRLFPSQFSGDSGGREYREQPPNLSKAEWIQQLRAEHQRKHRERQGMYPLDDREELYERELQEAEKKKYGQSAIGENYNVYDQRSRPSSRLQYEQRPPQPHNYVDYSAYSAPVPHYSHNSSNLPLPPRSHNMDYQHIRQNSDSYMDQGQDFYSRRPLSRSHTPVEHWQGDHMIYQQKSPYTRRDMHQADNYYGDAVFAYRDPSYTNMAGKRPVQTISQPGSAKV